MSKVSYFFTRIAILIALYVLPAITRAQVPNFSKTVGDGKLNGYTLLKVRPGINAQETYTALQFGIGDYVAAGVNLYTNVNSAYWGLVIRSGYKFNQWFGIGGEIVPSFNLNNCLKYSYTAFSLYMDGTITNDGKLFWCSNTKWNLNKYAESTIQNYEYLAYKFVFKNSHSLTPMAGLTHSWKFDNDPNPAIGLIYSLKKCHFYLWGDNFLIKNPRIVFGIQFIL